jgi:hypothetical protein
MNGEQAVRTVQNSPYNLVCWDGPYGEAVKAAEEYALETARIKCFPKDVTGRFFVVGFFLGRVIGIREERQRRKEK